jgi:hypothetical protein
MSPLRMVGLGLMAVALLFGAANIWFWVIDAPGGGISFYDLWAKVSLASLSLLQNFVEHYIWPPLWQGFHVVLLQPAWMIFGIIGMLCFGLGRKWED